jgi:proteic killer suppression protein
VYSGVVIREVRVAAKAMKQLRKVPQRIAENLLIWIEAVRLDGLQEVRKIPGYHDEPLKGKRAGQRSIRLSGSYRAIYEINSEGVLKFVSVEEVSKHDY